MSSPLLIALDREKKKRKKSKVVVRQEITDLVKSLFKYELDNETIARITQEE